MSKLFSLAVPNVADVDAPGREAFASIPGVPEFLCTVHQYAGRRYFVFVATHESGRYSMNEDAFKILLSNPDYADCHVILYSKMRKQGIKVERSAVDKFVKSGRPTYIDRSRAGAFYAFSHESLIEFCEALEQSERTVNWDMKNEKFGLPDLAKNKDVYNSTIKVAADACEQSGLILAAVDPINRIIYPLKAVDRPNGAR